MSDYRLLLRQESVRLSTFSNWPSEAISKESLARAGFFYLSSRDRACCAYCNIVIERWEPGDDAIAEHRRHSLRCDFVMCFDVGNEPIGEDPFFGKCNFCGPGRWCSGHDVAPSNNRERQQSVRGQFGLFPHEKPRSAEFISCANRLNTLEALPAAVAISGFYLRDKLYCECFHCGLQIKRDVKCQDWSRFVQDPRKYHEEESRNCAYLRLSNDIENGTSCSVCLERSVSVALVPCGHLVCFECCFVLEKCHYCREIIRSVLRVYF